MKKLSWIGCLVLALVIAIAPVAMAANYQAKTVGGFGLFQTGEGGEFTLLPNADFSWVTSSYAVGTKDFVQKGTFETFCAESTELIYPNTNYYVTISSGTAYQGVTLTKGAAWLYHEFQSGTLQGYDYFGATADRKASADLLQKALWYEMGLNLGQTNQYTTLAAKQGFNPTDANNGQFSVAIANLWADRGHTVGRQDVFICTPVPEPSTLIFLGSCLLGAAGLASRKFKI